MAHPAITDQPDLAQPVVSRTLSRLRLVVLMGLLALLVPVSALASCDILQPSFLVALALLLVSLQLTGLLLGAAVIPWRTGAGAALRAIAWALGFPPLVIAGGIFGLALWGRLPAAGLPDEAAGLVLAMIPAALSVGLIGTLALAPRAWWPDRAWRRCVGWAALVGLAVALGGIGLWVSTLPDAPAVAPAALPTAEPEVEIIMARFDLAAGSVLSDTALLEVQRIPVSRYDPLQHLSSTHESEGAMLRDNLRASEPLRRDLLDYGTPVLVARVDIPAATLITDVARLVRVEQVYGPQPHPQRQFSAFEQIYGASTVAPIAAGQPIERAMLNPATLPLAPPRPATPALVPVAALALAALTLVMLHVELRRPPRQTTRRPHSWRGLIALLGLAGIGAASVIVGLGLTEVGRQSALTIMPTEVPLVDVVRARVDLPASIVISDTAETLETVAIPATELEPEMVVRVAAAQGAVTRRPLRAGAAILHSDLFLPPDDAAAAPANTWGNQGTVYVWLTGAGAAVVVLLLASQVCATAAAQPKTIRAGADVTD